MNPYLDPDCSWGGFRSCNVRQVIVEALTCMGSDASLLAQQLYVQLASADSFLKSTRVCVDATQSTYEAIRDLGTFAFIASYLLSMGRRHATVIMDILYLIERLEELHTEVQGKITPPHLSTALIYYMSRLWSM